MCRTFQPDIVFLDIIMPVKNGIMAMEEIKQMNPNTKVVIVTSVGQEEMVQKAKDLKADGFVPKPFQPDQIRQIFHGLLKA
jgi:two-component system chemotaxis response regulator CheY